MRTERHADNAMVNPFIGLDLPSLVRARAKQFPDKPYLVWHDFNDQVRVWTYAQFEHSIARLAAGFHRAGLGPGQAVLIHLDNCPEALLSWHAAARIGALAVTTNTRSSLDELTYFASRCPPRAAITQPRYASLVRAACPQIEHFALIDEIADGVPIKDGERAIDAADHFNRFMTHTDQPPALQPDPMRPLCVQFTSGTTSRPKGVVWTHGNTLWGGYVSAAHQGLLASDIHFICLPLYHTNAQIYSALASLWSGASIVLTPRFSASRFWRIATRHRCTWFSTIGFIVKALMNHDRPARHSFRMWSPAVSAPELEDALGVDTMGWWGMTETVAQGIVGDRLEREPFMSIGRPSPFYEIRVLDAQGQTVREGETGDLYIRGRQGVSVFLRYLNDPQSTRAAFDDEGFLITGDRITLGEGGLMYFADRSKDMLKVGGENVAASEIERVIMGVPGVGEAAVVGKPDHMKGETPVAFVTIESDDADGVRMKILAACERELADFKRPTDIRFLETLPRATLEKVSKPRLRNFIAGEKTGG